MNKEELRRRLLHARRHRPHKQRDDAALATQCLRLLDSRGPGAVAAYHPLPSEPGYGSLLPALRSTGRDILLPITHPEGRLTWAYDAPTRTGALGIAEPTGKEYGGEILLTCALIVVPALGLTPQGYRLGKGGGYYDRSLSTLYRSGENRPPVAALVYPEEIRADISVEPHDQPVDYLVEPKGWRRQSK
ncbi:5-formyltetrahydrofolate cyclo-ligase [Corynebacterium lowii]|uniref:5-formyltetrahydrofolate cyclo-ligase n=1 Tax=Corynebacterium lowii TaxID=1544413 RepID=A0A0N8W087_9CORY|nr:5-formyltetrahydrofolate cyclo-ligase [Corynebacterium lowii]KQB86010.1 5-formyltetrahydrofolate cyclo-ligase family protein [Corynebacterium lowii]MDP9850560.1 5-formyltetrahydrofolate cyclo-ligase [Corynebacterium lowii]